MRRLPSTRIAASHTSMRSQWTFRTFVGLLLGLLHQALLVEGQFKPGDMERIMEHMKNQPVAEPAPPAVVPGETENVLALTTSTFNKTLKAHPSLLVLFYTEWSSNSLELRPKWVKAAAALRGQLVLARVDADAEEELQTRFQLKQYPSFLFFEKGKAVPLPETLLKRIEDIVPWAQVRSKVDVSSRKRWLKAEREAVLELDEDNINTTLKANPFVFIKFYAPSCKACDELRPAWAGAAKYLQGKVPLGMVDLSQNRLGARFDMQEVPSMKLVVHGGAVHDYTGSKREVTSLVRFVEDFEMKLAEDTSIFSEVDEDGFDEALTSSAMLLVQFYLPGDVPSQVLGIEFARAARTLQGVMRHLRVNVADEPKFAERLGFDVVNGSFPVLKFFQKGVAEEYDGSPQAPDIVKWAGEKAKAATKAEL